MTTPDNYESYTVSADKPDLDIGDPCSPQPLERITVPFALLVILVTFSVVGVGLVAGFVVFG